MKKYAVTVIAKDRKTGEIIQHKFTALDIVTVKMAQSWLKKGSRVKVVGVKNEVLP